MAWPRSSNEVAAAAAREAALLLQDGDMVGVCVCVWVCLCMYGAGRASLSGGGKSRGGLRVRRFLTEV